MDANLMTVGPLLARAWAIDHEISYFIRLSCNKITLRLCLQSFHRYGDGPLTYRVAILIFPILRETAS